MENPAAAEVRPFADVLSDLQRGVIADEAATGLAELVRAVQQEHRKGTVTLVIEVAPMKGNDEVLSVRGSVKVRAPQSEPAAGVFFATPDGALTRNDPNQLTLPLRDLPERTNAR